MSKKVNIEKLNKAAEIIARVCNDHPTCYGCPMYDNCNESDPYKWKPIKSEEAAQ